MFFLEGGANGTGTGTVTALKTFWRDVQKYYYLPIIMSDMRDRETNERNVGTSTLTIEIGDTNNHEHKPGHKEIFVYKYDFKGMVILLCLIYLIVYVYGSKGKVFFVY